MTGHKKSELIEVMDFLLKRFFVERIIYILLTLAAVVLLGFLVVDLFGQEGGVESILALLGPTGIITVTFSRILKMWTDCIELTKMSMLKKLEGEDEPA